MTSLTARTCNYIILSIDVQNQLIQWPVDSWQDLPQDCPPAQNVTALAADVARVDTVVGAASTLQP
jgi:hypothetical protein